MNGHRSDIKHNRNKPVAKQFNKSDHTLDNLRLAVIKKVKGKTKQQREVEEQIIIFKLDCVNQGLNRDYLFMSTTCNIYVCKREAHLCFLLFSPFRIVLYLHAIFSHLFFV